MINKQNNKLGWLFASPYIIFGLVFFLGPLIWSLYLSLRLGTSSLPILIL